MAEDKPTDLKEEVPELAPFDPTKKKKKKKVVLQDPGEEVEKLAEKAENLTVADVGEPSFVGMKKKKKKQVETDFLNDENGDAGGDLAGEQIGEEEEAEGIILGGGTRYPWEGSDRDYKYEELLGRVFNILRENNPDLAGDRRRTVMRPPQVLREGTKKTVFVNFMDLCKTMHRQPEHVMMFLLAEMGTSGSLDGQQRLVVKGRFAPKNFEGILRRYINWEMAPYIEAIDCQCDSYYAVRSFCDILRIRWEATRSRTKQRAMLMMAKLVEVFHESSPVAIERGWLAYGVYIPSIPALRKEYGELLVSCGMVGETLRIFEDLELWDNLIHCYQLLDKKAAAVDLIKARLQDVPNDPRLWCSLGDVTNDEAHYEKALEVSNNRSARAKRSLARNAYNRGDYVAAKDLWESALALNSLYPDGWFALGAAALKARDIDKALDAFTRAVQLDPDNGEAWNNVACLHMVKKKSKASFIAFKEALKFRRDSWQLWENFSHVAFDIGNFRQALEATKKVLELSGNKRTDVSLLDKILSKIEDRTRSTLSTEVHPPTQSLNDSDESGNEESVLAEPRERDLLLDMLGHILQQVVRNGGQGDIWGLYARWHKIKGNLTMCSEAFLKQVRSFQGSELWQNPERFKKFAHASLELCKVYMEIASSTGSQRELVMAEMHLRSSVRQAFNFSGIKELKDLEDCLDEVRRQLNAISSEAT